MVATRLGPIEVDETSLFFFPYGLPGFPEPRRFFLHGDADAVHWLLSAEGDRLGLPVLDPLPLLPDFLAFLPEDLRDPVPLVRTVVVPGSPPTTNVAAPILLDPRRHLGMQLILPEGALPPLPVPAGIG
jgi:flagellar assembly factor FliW